MERSAGVLGPGWERQLADGEPLHERTRAGDQRKPRSAACECRSKQGNYSGQPTRPPSISQ